MSQSFKAPPEAKTAKELGKAYDAWIIENATSYQVARFLGSAQWKRTPYNTLAAALEDAREDERALVYAITAEGRHALITRDKWPT